MSGARDFPPPLFDNEFVVLEQRLVKDRHLKLALDLDGRRFNAIWFSAHGTSCRARCGWHIVR